MALYFFLVTFTCMDTGVELVESWMLPGLEFLLIKYDKGARKERVVKGHDYD